MYTVQQVSTLALQLDAKNPRFILPDTGESQDNIRKYLLEQEDAIALTKNIVEYGGLMPGERIVVTKENDSYVVLEGNRRTCACQILIDRSLIPESVTNKIPVSSRQLSDLLSYVDVDVIPSREEARRFLATRHIERAREWSTIAKMRFCYEDYSIGHSVQQIKERTGLSISSINKYIKNYKILLRGLEGQWSPEEKAQLFILDIRPDKLIRIFDLSDTKRVLQLYFDGNQTLQSNLINATDLNEIIHVWTRKAFIENEMDTRTAFGEFRFNGDSTGACKHIAYILERYFNDVGDTGRDGPSTGKDAAASSGSNFGTAPSGNESDTEVDKTSGLGASGNSNANSNPNNGGGTTTGGGASSGGFNPGSSPPMGGGPNLSHFFGALNWSNVRESEHNGKGVIAVCKELAKISGSSSFVNSYPICTAFIIRALIEQSLKFYAKKKGYWAAIMQTYHSTGRNSGDPQLSFIINEFTTHKSVWIPDQNMRRIFEVVFARRIQVDKFNLVIHCPECYTLSPDSLKAIPGEGLLALANYFLA